MKINEQITKDDVARLTRGKSSRNRVGSRQVRHRLRQDELTRLNIARKRGLLVVNPGTRAALLNAWYLDCLARGVEYVCVDHLAAQVSPL
jgi:hypothetical protein